MVSFNHLWPKDKFYGNNQPHIHQYGFFDGNGTKITSSSSSSSSSSTSTAAEDATKLIAGLTILLTQMEHQNPLDPMDTKNSRLYDPVLVT